MDWACEHAAPRSLLVELTAAWATLGLEAQPLHCRPERSSASRLRPVTDRLPCAQLAGVLPPEWLPVLIRENCYT